MAFACMPTVEGPLAFVVALTEVHGAVAASIVDDDIHAAMLCQDLLAHGIYGFGVHQIAGIHMSLLPFA